MARKKTKKPVEQENKREYLFQYNCTIAFEAESFGAAQSLCDSYNVGENAEAHFKTQDISESAYLDCPETGEGIEIER